MGRGRMRGGYKKRNRGNSNRASISVARNFNVSSKSDEAVNLNKEIDEVWHDDLELDSEVHLGLPGDVTDDEDTLMNFVIPQTPSYEDSEQNLASQEDDINASSNQLSSIECRLGPSTANVMFGAVVPTNIKNRLGTLPHKSSDVSNAPTASSGNNGDRDPEEGICGMVESAVDDYANEFTFEARSESLKYVEDVERTHEFEETQSLLNATADSDFSKSSIHDRLGFDNNSKDGKRRKMMMNVGAEATAFGTSTIFHVGDGIDSSDKMPPPSASGSQSFIKPLFSQRYRDLKTSKKSVPSAMIGPNLNVPQPFSLHHHNKLGPLLPSPCESVDSSVPRSYRSLLGVGPRGSILGLNPMHQQQQQRHTMGVESGCLHSNSASTSSNSILGDGPSNNNVNIINNSAVMSAIGQTVKVRLPKRNDQLFTSSTLSVPDSNVVSDLHHVNTSSFPCEKRILMPTPMEQTSSSLNLLHSDKGTLLPIVTEKRTLLGTYTEADQSCTLSYSSHQHVIEKKINVEPSPAVADVLQTLMKPKVKPLLSEPPNSDNNQNNSSVFSRLGVRHYDGSFSGANNEVKEAVLPELSEIEKEMMKMNNMVQRPRTGKTLLPTPESFCLPDPKSFTRPAAAFQSNSSFSPAPPPISHSILNNAHNKEPFNQQWMLPKPSINSARFDVKEDVEEDFRGGRMQPEAALKAEIVKCFKEKRYAEGMQQLQDAANNYPDEFGDPVMCEVIEFCYKQGAISTAVLAAQFVREPDYKLLDFFAKVAERHKSDLCQLTDQLWIIFYRSLTQNPSAKSMMSFIKCFSALRSWNKVWTAIETFARKEIIPIEGMCLCLHALANGNGCEHLPTGVKILMAMSAQSAEKVGLECVDRLWLRCGLKGLNKCVDELDVVRGRLKPDAIAQERFAGQTRSKIMEMVMGVRVEELAVFVYALRSHVHNDAIRDFLVDAFSVAENYTDKLEKFLLVMSEKSHSEHVQSVEKCLASVCLRLVQRVNKRQHWDEVILLVELMQSNALRLDEHESSQVAECQLQALLRTGKLAAAAALLEDEGANCYKLSNSGTERLTARVPLLQQLYDLSTSARNSSRILLREACCALAGLLEIKSTDGGKMVQLNDADLNRQYNELLTLCCQRGTLESLQLGLNIIPSAHKNMLVINATVLRSLLVACFEHKQSADQLHFLDLGMQVGIYPNIEINRGAKKLALPTDLSTEEILVIITTLFRRMKAHLVEILSGCNAANPPDVLEECDVTVSAMFVGERDRTFVSTRHLDATETGLLGRLGQVLTAPNHFYCLIQPEPVVVPGGARALRLNPNAVYQCVYYMSDDC